MRRLALAVVALVLAAAAAGWIVTAPARIAPASLGPHTPDLANGRTLFFAGGCAACHVAPGAPDDERPRLAGGLALRSPFGTFVAPNISPHPTDGIGGWSEADFATAMLKGTSPDGRHYYPSFPYGSYARMPLGDVRDLFAFLKTLPPVAGRAAGHSLAFPYSIRRGVGVWKRLYLDERPFAPDPARDAAWNRGAYLVTGPGHCAECHSPRTTLGGVVATQRFAGGPDPEGGRAWVPNITRHALATWSPADFEEVLATGNTPEFSTVGGAMAPVIRNTRRLSGEDRRAMATYLASLPPVAGPTPPAK